MILLSLGFMFCAGMYGIYVLFDTIRELQKENQIQL